LGSHFNSFRYSIVSIDSTLALSAGSQGLILSIADNGQGIAGPKRCRDSLFSTRSFGLG